jgi:hypothetical protein
MRRHKNFIHFFILVVFFFILSTHGAYADDPPPIGQSKSIPSSIPGGQSKEKPVSADKGISSDIFGKQGGNFHPFLIFQELYTDNIFATDTHTKSDFITTIAPGVWLAFPANREKLLNIDTKTTSPGGLQLSRIKPEATRRYQSYFLYSPEFMLYLDHSSLDHVNHRAEGLFQYNLNSGLSFDIIDLFHDREEIAGNGIRDTLYRYQDNLLDFITTYAAPSGKFKFELEYSNYDIDYEDLDVTYRNRNDNSFGVSAFYKFWPKTSLFVEYNFSDIDFDGGTSTDSTENRYYAGATWDMTAKTRGTLKLGYIEKDFDAPAIEDQEGFSVELQTQHNLTPKRGLQINAFRKFNESDFGNASTFLSTGIDIALSQRFTEKWSGTFDVSFENNDYKGFDRTDDLFGVGPALRFEPRKWLIFDLGYHYYLNDSNITVYDYEVNQVYFRATLSL